MKITLDWTPIYCRRRVNESPAPWLYNSLTGEWKQGGRKSKAAS